MRFKLTVIAFLIASFMASSQTKIYLTANGQTRSVSLEDNSATATLLELLNKGSFTVRMSDYGGFEKVGSLPQSLPTSNSQITTVPGDIMLYQGNQMVIFYGSNSWSYTRLGKIDDATAEDVKNFLGSGAVEVVVSLDYSTGVKKVTLDRYTQEIVFDMMGRRINHRPLRSGIYIINGKKTAIN